MDKEAAQAVLSSMIKHASETVARHGKDIAGLLDRVMAIIEQSGEFEPDEVHSLMAALCAGLMVTSLVNTGPNMPKGTG